MKIRKAVLPAAGFGTRFLPATKVVPKELLPIVDKPTIQYIMEEVVAAGIEEVILITGREKGSIEDHLILPWNWRITSERKEGKISLRWFRTSRRW